MWLPFCVYLTDKKTGNFHSLITETTYLSSASTDINLPKPMKTLVACLGILLAVGNCSDNKEDVKPSETPISRLISEETDTPSIGDFGYFEGGHVFQPVVNGKITRLFCKLPKAGAYRICLWDVTSKTLLTQTTVQQTADATLTGADIQAVAVSTGRQYAISMLRNNYYCYASKSGPLFKYPIQKGNIRILSYVNSASTASATPLFSQESNEGNFCGYADFSFVPD